MKSREQNRSRFIDRFSRKLKSYSTRPHKLSSFPDDYDNRKSIRKQRKASDNLSHRNPKIEAQGKIRYDQIRYDNEDRLPVLPDDIIVEILVRLPVKSLLMFKCVSKFWNSCVSSEQFVKTHLQISSANANLSHQSLLSVSVCRDRCGYPSTFLKQYSLQSLVSDRHPYEADISFPAVDPTKEEEISVIGSCNGLCCIYVDVAPNIVLFNPSTTKYWILPCIDCLPQYSKFTHTRSGFGVSNDGDYKVVCAGRMGPLSGYSSSYVMAIYTLKTNSWRLLYNNYFFAFQPHGLFVNGKLHWLGPNTDTDDYSIFSFDLETETDGLIDLPNYITPCSNDNNIYSVGLSVEMLGGSLCMLGGSLCMVLDNPDISDVWLLKEYGINESWIKVFRVPTGLSKYFIKPLCVSEEGELLFVCGSTFTIYNPKNQSFKFPRLTKFPRCYYPGYFVVTAYVESLVSPFPHAE